MITCFISYDALDNDVNLFFGKLESHEELCCFDKNNFDFGDLALRAELFSSKTQARKNGWAGPIPLGFGERKCGKKKIWWFNSMDNRLD